MSGDKFWDQWNSASEEEPQKPAEPAASGEPAAPVDADVLAAWLKSLPPNDPLVPPPTHDAPRAAETAAPSWPPEQPVDPFAGGASSSGDDWDLVFDPPPGAAGVAVTPPVYGTPSAAPKAPDEPALPDLIIPADPEPAISPFGPAPPAPAPPPPAAGQRPLRLEINLGKRTLEQDIHGEALIGRPDATRGIHPEIDLRLDDAVSRRHAKIFVEEGKFMLTDLNSTNGTLHNRKLIPAEVHVPLQTGDVIEVGEMTQIRVLEAP